MECPVNPRLKKAEYAVRGAIPQRAGQISADLASGRGEYPFSSVLSCNVGNPQSLGQAPLTYCRQILVCTEYPQVRAL